MSEVTVVNPNTTEWEEEQEPKAGCSQNIRAQLPFTFQINISGRAARDTYSLRGSKGISKSVGGSDTEKNSLTSIPYIGPNVHCG